jgi:DnaJ-class molecular chaperone
MKTTHNSPCPHCDGKGYNEIRDCSGEIQREETCCFCGGTGALKEPEGEGTIHSPILPDLQLRLDDILPR